jgi:transposase
MDTALIDSREARGLALSNDRRIKRIVGNAWSVPSASGTGAYVVDVAAGACSCPDHETRRTRCKHLHAALTVLARETTRETTTNADGSTAVREVTREVRVTYSQDWPSYNAAQCAEKATVQALLKSLCEGIQTPPHPGRGPKPVPLSDAVYGMTMKVYTTFSGRRATTDLETCADAGHMTKAPRYNTLFDAFQRPDLTALLTTLVEESAAPLACVESQFAADSTGFGTSVFRRWYDAKYGHEMKEHTWIKAHAMIGVKTNVITAIRVTDGNGADSPELPALVASTAKSFNVAEVSADKAYLAHRNLDAIEAVGAVPYVPFKLNSQGEGPAAWRRMWGLFMYRQPEFLARYHARSNVESTFSAIKRKFGGSVRSKNPTAQVNEVLCKALCFNLSCLVHAMFELGIEPTFATSGVAT